MQYKVTFTNTLFIDPSFFFLKKRECSWRLTKTDIFVIDLAVGVNYYIVHELHKINENEMEEIFFWTSEIEKELLYIYIVRQRDYKFIIINVWKSVLEFFHHRLSDWWNWNVDIRWGWNIKIVMQLLSWHVNMHHLWKLSLFSNTVILFVFHACRQTYSDRGTLKIRMLFTFFTN